MSDVSAYYVWPTRHGLFRISLEPNGWAGYFEAECLVAALTSAQAVLDEVADGHVFWPSAGDPSKMGLPRLLYHWQFVTNGRTA